MRAAGTARAPGPGAAADLLPTAPRRFVRESARHASRRRMGTIQRHGPGSARQGGDEGTSVLLVLLRRGCQPLFPPRRPSRRSPDTQTLLLIHGQPGAEPPVAKRYPPKPLSSRPVPRPPRPPPPDATVPVASAARPPMTGKRQGRHADLLSLATTPAPTFAENGGGGREPGRRRPPALPDGRVQCPALTARRLPPPPPQQFA